MLSLSPRISVCASLGTFVVPLEGRESTSIDADFSRGLARGRHGAYKQKERRGGEPHPALSYPNALSLKMEGYVAQINAEFVLTIEHLAALAYGDGFECPPLKVLYRWIREEMGASSILNNASGAAPLGAPLSSASNTNDLFLAIASAPAGLTPAELKTMFPRLEAHKLGPLIAALKRSSRIEKSGNRWVAVAPAAATANATQVPSTPATMSPQPAH